MIYVSYRWPLRDSDTLAIITHSWIFRSKVVMNKSSDWFNLRSAFLLNDDSSILSFADAKMQQLEPLRQLVYNRPF